MAELLTEAVMDTGGKIDPQTEKKVCKPVVADHGKVLAFKTTNEQVALALEIASSSQRLGKYCEHTQLRLLITRQSKQSEGVQMISF